MLDSLKLAAAAGALDRPANVTSRHRRMSSLSSDSRSNRDPDRESTDDASDAAALPILPAFQGPFRSALALLEQGRQLASDTGSSAMRFGVDLHQLRRLGIPDMLMTWMVAKGIATAEISPSPMITGPTDKQGRDEIVYILTKQGIDVAQRILGADAMNLDGLRDATSFQNPANRPEPSVERDEQIKPKWDDVRKELWYSGQLIKRYKLPSMNQETVLTAFQEEDWPLRIDDPLPPNSRQSSQVRLGNTIKALNRNQRNALLRFRGDGTGEGVLWERAGRST